MIVVTDDRGRCCTLSFTTAEKVEEEEGRYLMTGDVNRSPTAPVSKLVQTKILSDSSMGIE